MKGEKFWFEGAVCIALCNPAIVKLEDDDWFFVILVEVVESRHSVYVDGDIMQVEASELTRYKIEQTKA